MGVFYNLLAILLIYFSALSTHARPEYAAKNKMRCTLCHFSASGGSLRNITGKAFGYRGFAPGKWSQQDTVSLDVRGMLYQPDRGESTGGMALMAGVVGAAVPLESSEDGKETTLVFSHNIGGFAATSAMDTFLRWKNYDDYESKLQPQYITIGRFHAPFGILTDEHNTYTKIQTQNSWRNLEMGAMISSEISTDWHYDFALVNGTSKSGGTGFTSEGTNLWGGVLNVRWMPAPLVGASTAFYKNADGSEDSYANSIYVVTPTFIFDGSVTAEIVEAKNMNSGISRFVEDNNYLSSVATETSQGRLLKLNYNLSDKWTLTYKYDWLALDKNFPADAYIRHGLGFKRYIGPNMFVLGRIEEAIAQRPDETTNNPKFGAKSAGWLMLTISI